MKKTVYEKDVYYHIIWSQIHRYDKYDAQKVLPELPGILCLLEGAGDDFEYLIFLACWRDGLRVGLKKFLDPDMTKFRDISMRINTGNLYYKYTAVDSSADDLRDVLFWLIMNYRPLYNSGSYKDSERFLGINVKEGKMRPGDVVEKFSGI